MNEIAKRDENFVPVLTGITDDSDGLIRMLRVDPVTGRLLISVSGSSSSGFQQPTSGTVDGSNTVFEWATEPNVIVVDNVSRQKVSSNGHVNWTGTTTTTLEIAPNDDIFSTA